MAFKQNKKSHNKKKYNNNNNNSNTNTSKFLYQRQENRKKQLKSEEDLWESVSDSESQDENQNKNLNENFDESNEEKENSEQDNEEISERSDSDSENIIYKNEIEEEEKMKKLNSEKFLKNIKLNDEEKEKINSLFLDSIENCRDLKKKIDYTTEFVKNPNNETKFGLSFLDSKNGLMIMYESYLMIYSMMKLSGVNVEKNLLEKNFNFNTDKNLLKSLISSRTFLEKIKTIDIKLKSQIERFMKLSDQDADENNEESIPENDDEEVNAIAMRVI